MIFALILGNIALIKSHITVMANTRSTISNWVKSSNYDIKTAEHMLKTGRHIYVLFMCHLSVEKLLKAIYEAALKRVPPKTHNLINLANSVNLQIPEQHLKLIESLNDLSIVTRYPEDIDSLIRAFRRSRVENYLLRTKEFLKWLKQDARLKE